MRVLITGLCGFAGSTVALELQHRLEGLEVFGVDNLSRPGSELNRKQFKARGIRCLHADIRNPSDLENLPAVDWVIDAAANPSVLAGISGQTSSRQLMEHNMVGTLNLLEFCKRHRAGFVMFSTSRVYSLECLASLPMDSNGQVFSPRFTEIVEPGVSIHGIAEDFSTEPPLSLYGTAKRASELLALEYGRAFDLPVYINRCGVLAGAGQFGKPDQGIFTFWIHSCRYRRTLRYIGFGGMGLQVRDCLHPLDLAELVAKQLLGSSQGTSVLNVSGGMASHMSLAQLTTWCAARFGPHTVASDTAPRRFDVPWLVLDSSRAQTEWNWRPTRTRESILTEIADHAEQHPEWLEVSSDP
jgi:CDP-paratose 2-epimerase